MPFVSLHNKETIESFLRRNAFLHLYALGDLDDFFWPYTTWYALEDQGRIEQVILLYTVTETPTLLALTEDAAPAMAKLLRAAKPLLPQHFYAHVHPASSTVLAESYVQRSHRLHYKMALTKPPRFDALKTHEVISLSVTEAPELERLYAESYPGNWFEPRMLQTGHYYGIRRDGKLISAAGVHVYSPRYRVAALGNITTHPRYRGHGLARIVTARLCQELSKTTEHIGLNVRADNADAIACYARIGFERVAEYAECEFVAKSNATR
jgi:ribosomal protein S18 acetylase RimI-like enzyme